MSTVAGALEPCGCVKDMQGGADHAAAFVAAQASAAPHALVLGGGVLRAQQSVLHDQVVRGAVAQAPQVRVSVLDTPPAVGAALLALDALGTAGRAETAVRTTPAAAEPGAAALFGAAA